ncbi:hypothetical protein F5Y19DRAFT_476181 [Xylariaceae sp. FL1651]|nr:hypothetical protein F5Y19DRAFT_476181 [Xylariaceae sp. FL1651]
MVNNSQSRGQLPPRTPLSHHGRLGVGQLTEDSRFTDFSEARRPPWPIDKGLRELCQIPGNNFFVAAEENGKVICLSTPLGSSQLDHQRFFNEKAFLREINRVQQGMASSSTQGEQESRTTLSNSVLADNQSYEEPELSFGTEMNRYASETNRTRALDHLHGSDSVLDSFNDEGSYRARKRPRGGVMRREASIVEESFPRPALPPKRGIKIGDEQAVWNFYDQRFRNIQQTACKLIAKAWVKAVEPKKQSTHPYTGGDKTRPDWWPKLWGPQLHQKVRHKEPDHLGKSERLHLLCHILRMIVEPPHKQHQAVRKAGLNVKKLEDVTYEALSPWFSDNESPSNLKKKPMLKEVFKVARQEEQFKDGGIDALTEVFVSADEKTTQGSTSDTEEFDSQDGEPDQKLTPASSNASPLRQNAPQIMMPHLQAGEPSESDNFPGNTFNENVPIRETHYTHPGFDADLPSERPSYVETSSMVSHAPNYNGHLGLPEMYPSPHGTSRRSSVFNSPPDYASPATPAMYAPWQSSNAPNNSSMYAFPTQASNVQAPFGGQITQSPSYMAPQIDGLPRQTNDAHHGNIFASRGVSQGPLHHQQGYSNYVADAGSMVGSGTKTEGIPHPSVPQ